MIWWPIWIALTGALWLAAHFFGAGQIARSLLAILIGLCVVRAVVWAPFTEGYAPLCIMAIMLAVSTHHLSHGLYLAALFGFLSSASYFKPWESYLAADLFGLAMLLALGGGIYVDSRMDRLSFSSRMGDWGGALHGGLVGRTRSLQVLDQEKAR